MDDDGSNNYTPVMLGEAKLQRLTETEGRILALIARLDAPTAYTIYAVLEDSPTSALQASKGTIYPVVERLKQRGYLIGTPNDSNARGGETLSVTDTGMAAIRDWLTEVRDEHILVYDPLRARIPALQFLSHDERLAWVASVKMLNQQKADQVAAYRPEADDSLEAIARNAAFSSLAAQSKWLDRLFVELSDHSEIKHKIR